MVATQSEEEEEERNLGKILVEFSYKWLHYGRRSHSMNKI